MPIHVISSDAERYYQGYLTGEARAGMHLPSAVLNHFGINSGLELFLASQVPSGTGLGSSSALAVALIHAVASYVGCPLEPTVAAALACEIEIERLHAPIGKQDQYASALGGLNEISFTADGVAARPLQLSPATRASLEQRLMLFFTGIRRDANEILASQRMASEQREPRTITSLHALKHLAQQVMRSLEVHDLDAFGNLLHEGWMQKRQLSQNISNAFIDHCYDTARRNGALGGKIVGAGGGGFLLLDCPIDCQSNVTAALHELGLQAFAFGLDDAPAGLCGEEAGYTPHATDNT